MKLAYSFVAQPEQRTGIAEPDALVVDEDALPPHGWPPTLHPGGWLRDDWRRAHFGRRPPPGESVRTLRSSLSRFTGTAGPLVKH